MIDLDRAAPRYDKETSTYVDLDGDIGHPSHAQAAQTNVLLLLARISNNLERIANTQELMQKNGEEASKKADSTLQAAMGAFKGLGGL